MAGTGSTTGSHFRYVTRPGGTLGFSFHGFWAGRESLIFGVSAAPATVPESGGRSPPPSGIVVGAAGAAQIPKIEDSRPDQKPCIKNPSVPPGHFRYVSRPGGMCVSGRTPSLPKATCERQPHTCGWTVVGLWLDCGWTQAPTGTHTGRLAGTKTLLLYFVVLFFCAVSRCFTVYAVQCVACTMCVLVVLVVPYLCLLVFLSLRVLWSVFCACARKQDLLEPFCYDQV